MTAHAITHHLQAAGAEFRECCNKLDDADGVRNFLRNWHGCIPDALIATSYGADRIQISPQYRALHPDAQRLAEWALGACFATEPHGLFSHTIGSEHLDAAIEMFRQAVNATDEADEAHEIADNAAADLRGVLAQRERDAEVWESELVFAQRGDVAALCPRGCAWS